MKLKIFKHIIYVLLTSGISALCSYLANSSLIFDKMVDWGIIADTKSIPVIQDYCLWIGILFSAVFISLNLIITTEKYLHTFEERNALLCMSKDILRSSLSTDFDIRIFIPKHPLLYKIADFLHISNIKKKFIIKNIDSIAKVGLTRNLEFEVSPNPKGLVGLCYKQKSMIYDDDLEHTNETEIYDLNSIQIKKTHNLKWIICCPVLGKSGEVAAIMSLDGKSKITINARKESEIKEELYTFSQTLYEYSPQFFKR